MKSKIIPLSLAALLAFFSLAGCDRSAETDAETDSETTADAASETASEDASEKFSELTAETPAGTVSEVDYSLADNWAYYASAEDDTPAADVFFVCPTVYGGADDACNMDIEDDDSRESFLGATNMEKGIYDEGTRFFAPYYGQAGMNVYEMSEADMEPYMDLAYADVKDAFLYYLEEENDGNPIVLAGFSQGADMCIRLLEDCFADEDLQDLLVACYAIGWRITEEDMDEYPQLTYVEDADDTGVLITFDVEDPEIEDSIIVPKGTKSLCVNPLTWSTDATVADKSLNLGACFTNYDGEITQEIPEFTGAYIDEERGVLKVTDVSPEDYPSGLSIFEDGSYHTYDYEFFYRNLQENVQERIDAYLK